MMWLVGSKPITWNVTTPTTLFSCILCHHKFVTINLEPRSPNVLHNWSCVTCVITSPIISTLSILNNWRHGRGVDSPVTTQFWKLSLDLKQCDLWRNGLTRLKCLITGQGQYFYSFCFCSQHAQRCSSFILNFSVCFKLYTQPTTSFNAC